jgi:hypothetical protein
MTGEGVYIKPQSAVVTTETARKNKKALLNMAGIVIRTRQAVSLNCFSAILKIRQYQERQVQQMNDIIFSNPEFGNVRTVTYRWRPWLVGIDVAKALGCVKERNAIVSHTDKEDAIKCSFPSKKENH